MEVCQRQLHLIRFPRDLTSHPEQKKAALRRVEMELDEADEMVRIFFFLSGLTYSKPTGLKVSQMEIEIQGIPQSIRPKYQSRIRTSKADLARYKKLSREMHAQASRADLFSSRGGVGAPATSDEPYGSSDRARLLAGTTILEDGSRRLQESQRIALETEEQGADILRSLVGQREQIENARNTVRFSFSCM